MTEHTSIYGRLVLINCIRTEERLFLAGSLVWPPYKKRVLCENKPQFLSKTYSVQAHVFLDKKPSFHILPAHKNRKLLVMTSGGSNDGAHTNKIALYVFFFHFYMKLV